MTEGIVSQKLEPTVTVGVDIGSDSTKIVLGPNNGCEIVRSDVGGHTTPTAVSFSGKCRHIGESANLKAPNAVLQLNRLVEEKRANDLFGSFYRFAENEKGITVDYDGTQTYFESAAMIAMLLGKIRRNVLATLARTNQSVADEASVQYVLSMPPGASVKARVALGDAAFAAGLGDHARVVNSAECIVAALARKLASVEPRTVLVVDMGHAQTCVYVLQSDASGDNDTTEQEPEENTTDTTKEHSKDQPIKVLSSVCNRSLGAGSVDVRLWQHFESTVPALKGHAKNSRGGQRLLDACRRLKHLLSQLPDGRVTVENIKDRDVPITCTRSTLADLCQPDVDSLVALMTRALEEAGGMQGADIDAVEIMGGGCRIPLFQSAISEALGSALILSHSLDDTSVALGAGMLGNHLEKEESASEHNHEFRQKLFDAEQRMAAIDEEIAKLAEIRNQMEAYILEIRSAKQEKHAALLPNLAVLDAHLDQADDWLFSEESDKASLIDMEAKLSTTMETTNQMCNAYLDAVKNDADEKDREMEEEAKLAQAERNAVASDEEEDDHDNRRLTKKRRLEIVMKNKAEANELFSDGNYRHAAARYTKALTHCAKFVDLSPDDQAEVKAVKLSLNLNLALAYVKLEKPDQALRVCNEAIHIDAKSAKALYRRATIYFEKKRWSDAMSDLNKASSVVPDDKAIKRLQAKVEVMIKKQNMKEKKMAQKMFS